jgi:Mrp family chromosome partitioning ATPase
LAVLPAGPTPRNPLTLLTGKRFLELIECARASYDLVLIDSPPLLPVVDTRILREMADMLVFVVRADATPPQAAVRSLQNMRDVTGVVFNYVSPGSFRRYYYYDAYSRYAYGDDAAEEADEEVHGV